MAEQRPTSPIAKFSHSYTFGTRFNVYPAAKHALLSTAKRLCASPKPLVPAQEIRPRRKLDLSRLKFDNTQGFVETCMTINTHLAATIGAYGGECEIVSTDELLHTQRQLRDKEVCISVFGRHNCGKSTLLNSLAGEMFLPVCIESETTLQVKIYHSADVHKPGLCPKRNKTGFDVEQPSCVHCARLVECYGDKVVNTSYGDNDIHDVLQKWNNDIREKIKTVSEIPELCLYVHAPILSGTPEGWKVCLVDNAGFGEATEHVAQLASRSMKLSSAYIYLVNAGSLNDAVDSESYKTLSYQDKNCFHERRFVAVITKMDDFYKACRRPDARKTLTEEQVKNKVHDSVKEATGYEVSRNEDIIPVIGQWALTAQLLSSPITTEENRKFYFDEALEGLKLHSRHKLSDKKDKYWEDHKQEVPTALMAASGVELLERRIRQMSKSCVRVWTEKISSDYLQYVLKAGESLFVKYTELEDEINRNVAVLGDSKSQCDEIQGYINDLRIKMDKSKSSVYTDLCREYLKDIEHSAVVSYGKTKAKELVEGFREDTRTRIRKQTRDFGPEDFSRELEDFLEQTRGTLEGIFNNMCVFNGLQNVYTRCIADATESYTIMRTSASKLLKSRKRITKETFSDDISVRSSLKAPNLGEVKEKVTIPQVRLTLLEKAWEWVLSIFKVKGINSDGASSETDRSYYRSWSSEHEQAFGELLTRIEEECSNYVEVIKPQTVEYFFQNYCHFTQRKVQNFDREFKVQLDDEIHQMQELRRQNDCKDIEREDLQYMCMRLDGLKLHLIEATKEYLESQGYAT